MTPIKVSIVAKSMLTPSTACIRFTAEPGLFRFEPGQWVDLWVPGIERPGGFTFISSPSQWIEQAYFELAVKQSHNPVVRWLHESAAPGDEVHIAIGGDFTMRDAQTPMVFVAGGVGINPFRAMLTTLREASQQPAVWLFYAAKNLTELAFHREFLDLATRPWFHYHPSLTHDASWPGRSGRWDAQQISGYVGNHMAEADFYLCGPDSMVSDLATQLERVDIRTEHLMYERWS